MLLFLLSILNALTPLKQEIKFHHLTTDDGLSQATVYDIVRDSTGYMWFATEGGLNRFDGHNYTVFQEEKDDSTSLVNNIIFSLALDYKGMLWAGTINGLSRYDPENENFISYKNIKGDSTSLPSNDIRALYIDRSKRLWIGTTGGLCYKRPDRPGFIRIQSEKISNNAILSINEDSENRIWFGTLSGAYYINSLAQESSIKKIEQDLGTYVYALEFIGDTLLAGSNKGLTLLNLNNNEVFNYNRTGTPDGPSDLTVYRMVAESDSVIWLGTMGGLNRFDLRKGHFESLQHSESRAYSISDNRIFSLFMENNPAGNRLWVGTMNQGISILDYKRMRFPHYRHNPEQIPTIPGDYVSAIIQDSQNNIWIGTYEGLVKTNPDKDKMVEVTTGDKRYLQNQVHSLLEASNGDIWIGTFGGLFQYSPKTNSMKLHWAELSDSTKLSNNLVDALEEDHVGNIWVGTKAGINRFHPESRLFKRYILNPGTSLESVSVILEDSQKRLWVGTLFGLFVYDRSGDRFKMVTQEFLKDDVISALLEDESGCLWVGTKNGLYQIERDSLKRHYTIDDGLPHNYVRSVLNADDGSFWISTYNGLARLQPESGQIRHFSSADGLQGSAFTPGSCKLANGLLVFGGTKGMNIIDPLAISETSSRSEIVITDISTIKGDLDLKTPPDLLERFELTHNHGFFEIHFALLDFTDSYRNQYKYKLDGFDSEWMDNGTRRFARYTQVPPGTYLLQIRASNNNGVWSSFEKTLPIYITPPFWATAWFRIMGILIFLLIIFLVIHIRVQTKSKRVIEKDRIRQAENERIRKKTAQDFHDGLGHKLAKINLLSQTAQTIFGTKVKGLDNHLKMIQEIAGSMHTDMHNLLWMLDPIKDSLFEVIVKIKDFAEELFDKSGISFHSSEIPDLLNDFRLTFDQKTHLLLLFQEVFNNSLKHSDGSMVHFECSIDNNELRIQVSDNGKGLCEENTTNGYGLRNIRERAGALSGKLTFLSQPAEGLTIRLKLKLPDQVGAENIKMK